MTATLKLLLIIALSWRPTWYPPGGGPETPEERTERVTMATHEAYAASQGRALQAVDLVSLVMVVWKYESGNLDYHVHGGEPSPIGHADRGTSMCLGQIKHVEAWWTEAEWRALAGRDRAATRRCDDATVRILEYHLQRCGLRKERPASTRWDEPLRAHETAVLLNAYATGLQCSGGKHERASAWLRLRNRLEAAR